ncbi:hypothetical protein [Collimonas sp.]|jgi:hypothetical protein|uniref:hypothetical protein n=1 Tax=Collimonas sp. TaxID=1963772 RepID=UPI002C5E517D|nr:hypothetical protein [Collimonas sp.]HWW07538.1 hypothetical protein [Collimonas sp.]
MKAFWNDCGEGPIYDSSVDLSQAQVNLIWSDEIRGVEGNFLGLTDDRGNTIQFYFSAGIPDEVEDASHLKIVLVDFPVKEKRGSYSKQVTIGEVLGLIAIVFDVGASHQSFNDLSFGAW